MDAYYDDLIEYVLEELPEDRYLQLRTHLDSGCVECNKEVRQLLEAFHFLPGALPAYKMKAELKTKLLDAINSESVQGVGLQSRMQHSLKVANDLQFVRTTETIDSEKPFEQSSIRTIRIAVLYFENLSEEKENDYFRAGMTEDIITELSKVRAWEVRPRTQVVQFKDQTIDIRNIGQDLGVTHVLHGSIRKAGNRLRISAHLVDSASASSVWGERYDRDLSDVFEIQAEIAQKIAAALRVHLTQAEQKQIQKRHNRKFTGI